MKTRATKQTLIQAKHPGPTNAEIAALEAAADLAKSRGLEVAAGLKTLAKLARRRKGEGTRE